MNKLTLILPFALVTHLTLAQSSVPTGLDAERNLAAISDSKTGAMIRTHDNRYEGVKGTPFFHEEWVKASATMNNTLLHNVDLKYNIYEKQVLYRNAQGEEFILDPSMIDGFVLTDAKTQKKHTFEKFPALAAQDVDLLKQYVLVIYESEKASLVMVPEKILVKADFKGAYSADRKYDEFVDAHTYYFIGPDKKATKVKLNKKNLLRSLPDKKDKVQEYVSANNLDLSSEAGWTKALAYYESL